MKKLILFDFNGTIIDDNDLWYGSVCEVFKVFGKTPPSVADYFHSFEKNGLLETYKLYGVDASLNQLNEIYVPYYTAKMYEPNLFLCTKVTLLCLAMHDNFSLGLITSQPEGLVKPLLKKFGIEGYFRPEFISMHDFNKKDTIQKMVDASGVDKNDCFYVGDAPSDIKYGNNAGIQTVAFLNGFIPADLVLDREPKHSIRQFDELIEVVLV